jgi:hypothetical protein
MLSTSQLRKRLDIYVNDDELAAIQKKASQVMMPVSLYMRRTALSLRIDAPPPAQNIERWRQLAPLEANINQIARACNAGRVTEEIYPALTDLAEQVRLLRMELIGANDRRRAR